MTYKIYILILQLVLTVLKAWKCLLLLDNLLFVHMYGKYPLFLWGVSKARVYSEAFWNTWEQLMIAEGRWSIRWPLQSRTLLHREWRKMSSEVNPREPSAPGSYGLCHFTISVLTCWEIMKNDSMRSATVNRLLRVACILRGKTGLWMICRMDAEFTFTLGPIFFSLIRVLLTLRVQDAKHRVEPNKRINIKLKRHMSLPREARNNSQL